MSAWILPFGPVAFYCLIRKCRADKLRKELQREYLKDVVDYSFCDPTVFAHGGNKRVKDVIKNLTPKISDKFTEPEPEDLEFESVPSSSGRVPQKPEFMSNGDLSPYISS